jgi:hypothetical protein
MSDNGGIDWTSYDFLSIRTDMLGEDLVMTTYNGALKAYAKTKTVHDEIAGFEWKGIDDGHMCDICSDRHLNIYSPWHFLPDRPHFGCRCSLDVILH